MTTTRLKPHLEELFQYIVSSIYLNVLCESAGGENMNKKPATIEVHFILLA